MKFDLSLYLVTDRDLSFGRPLSEIVEKAIQGGVTMVQLREKDCSSRTFYEEALSLKQILKSYNIPLIVNDRVDIALACDADGIHIGQSDLPYDVVRKLMGTDKIIGLSVENKQDVMVANQMDVDYIGISPVFNTTTKTDTAPALGLGGVKELSALSVHPCVAIGGINLLNTKSVIRSGADGIAVVSAIISSAEPDIAARELKDEIITSRYQGC